MAMLCYYSIFCDFLSETLEATAISSRVPGTYKTSENNVKSSSPETEVSQSKFIRNSRRLSIVIAVSFLVFVKLVVF